MHLRTHGILDELVDGIRELIDDLETELMEVNKNFARRTDNHNRDVIRLEQEIQDADREIFNGDDMIDNVLYPTRKRFINALNQLKSNIDDNRKTLDEETLMRNKEKETFEATAAEHNMAISAIDECLGLLSSITNPSLMQIRFVQSSLTKLEKQFANHSVFSPLIRALLELANE